MSYIKYTYINLISFKQLHFKLIKQVINLSCFHYFFLYFQDVFHWLCLNQHAQCLPANTAPAGYTCPSCSTCIFPPSNLATPVAEALRVLLQQVNWARAGLGLPLVSIRLFVLAACADNY